MIHRLLADAVLLIHLGFVLFVVLGGLVALRWRAATVLHLPSVTWGVALQLAGWTCPLTPLENHLRMLGGRAGYDGGFVEHYLLSIIYPAGLTRGTQLVLAAGVLVTNVAVYAYLLRRDRPQAEPTAVHDLQPLPDETAHQRPWTSTT